MGCDGGTIPKRDELVRTKHKGEQKDKSADLMAKWRHCWLTSNRLTKPIVSCELGRLYNKESVITYLLNKDSSPNAADVKHIRGLKDVIVLNLTEKADYEDKRGECDDTLDSLYICPVVALEMNGKYKFCYLRTCGCVMSERALKEVKTDNCHKCGQEFGEEDIVIINGSDEEVEALRKSMEERRAKAKDQKKSKKRKTEETKTNASNNKVKAVESSISGPSKSTASTSQMSSSSLVTGKASQTYSVAKDSNASETYKSLFTSHESAKNKPKAHWVTFNPCYY